MSEPTHPSTTLVTSAANALGESVNHLESAIFAGVDLPLAALEDDVLPLLRKTLARMENLVQHGDSSAPSA